MRPPAGKPHSPRLCFPQHLQENLLAVLTPWLTGTCSVSPFLAAGNFLLSRCLALQATGFPSAGLLECRAACPEAGKQLSPHREDSSVLRPPLPEPAAI